MTVRLRIDTGVWKRRSHPGVGGRPGCALRPRVVCLFFEAALIVVHRRGAPIVGVGLCAPKGWRCARGVSGTLRTQRFMMCAQTNEWVDRGPPRRPVWWRWVTVSRCPGCGKAVDKSGPPGGFWIASPRPQVPDPILGHPASGIRHRSKSRNSSSLSHLIHALPAAHPLSWNSFDQHLVIY